MTALMVSAHEAAEKTGRMQSVTILRPQWVAAGGSTVSAACGLQGRAAFGGSRCQTGKGCSSKSLIWKHTCSTFLFPFTLYRSTKPIT
jgi:hypothetical protein